MKKMISTVSVAVVLVLGLANVPAVHAGIIGADNVGIIGSDNFGIIGSDNLGIIGSDSARGSFALAYAVSPRLANLAVGLGLFR